MVGVPKPRKARKAKPKPIARTRVKAANSARKAREFARAYGSKARVAWVKSLPCCVCRALSPYFGYTQPSHNAHTEGGGAGRKAGYATIAPMCPTHHKRYDEHREPFDQDIWRRAAKLAAISTEVRWQLEGLK